MPAYKFEIIANMLNIVVVFYVMTMWQCFFLAIFCMEISQVSVGTNIVHRQKTGQFLAILCAKL